MTGRPRSNISDHSAFSRKQLGEAVGCTELAQRLTSMERGSTALLRALWMHHHPILMTLYAQGRRVVRP